MKMKKIKYIFCINTGRSGSHYLSKVFSHVSGCLAFHEPNPIGNGKAMIQYLKGNSRLMERLTQQKVDRIKELKNKKNFSVYVETNHCFIKGFGWLIPNYLPEDEIGVVILKRDKAKIAKSLLRIGFSPLNQGSRGWIATPEIKNPLVEPPSLALIPPRISYYLAYSLNRCIIFLKKRYHNLTLLKVPTWLTSYELKCLHWYVDETYAQSIAFKEKFKQIKYYEITLESLNSTKEVNKMLDHFGLRSDKSLSDIIGNPTNLRNNTKDN